MLSPASRCHGRIGIEAFGVADKEKLAKSCDPSASRRHGIASAQGVAAEDDDTQARTCGSRASGGHGSASPGVGDVERLSKLNSSPSPSASRCHGT